MSAGSAIATGFFTITGAGILAGLLAAPRAELGRFFSALNATLALVCVLLAVAFGTGGAGIAAGILSFLFVSALYLPQGRGGRGVLPGGRGGTWLLALAAASAAGAAVVDGWRVAAGRGPLLHAMAAVAAGALLGSVIVGMNLGHWYLVRVRLSEGHLVRFARLLGGAVALRAGLLVMGLLIYGAMSPGGLGTYLRAVTVERGFFFWQRVFFGLLGPAVLAWMVFQTARIRSTQSATGILYIATMFVLVGEFLARFLTVQGAGPM